MAQGTRILIVDDDQIWCELAEYILQTNGFATVVVQTGEGGRRALRAQQFDLVLLDMHLGDESGCELLGSLRDGSLGSDPKTPVIMLTSDSTFASVVGAARQGIQGYLLKPCSPRTLVEKLRSALHSPVGVHVPQPQPVPVK